MAGKPAQKDLSFRVVKIIPLFRVHSNFFLFLVFNRDQNISLSTSECVLYSGVISFDLSSSREAEAKKNFV